MGRNEGGRKRNKRGEKRRVIKRNIALCRSQWPTVSMMFAMVRSLSIVAAKSLP